MDYNEYFADRFVSVFCKTKQVVFSIENGKVFYTFY